MHIIRLRGPWELKPVLGLVVAADGLWTRKRTAAADLPNACRQTMPADWSATLGQDFAGCVSYRRSFHRPTNLQSSDSVWLVVEPPRSTAAIHLNGELLGSASEGEPAARFEINARLKDRNQLEIFVSHPALDSDGNPAQNTGQEPAGGLIGEVRLEISSVGDTPN